MVEQLTTEADAVEALSDVQQEVQPAKLEETPEPPKVEQPPVINWEQKAKELEQKVKEEDQRNKALQRTLQNRPKENELQELRKTVANLEEMMALVLDAQSKEVDEDGNPKITQSNVQKVRESRFEESKNVIGAEIVNTMKQYGLADMDPRVGLAAELWTEGLKEKDINKINKSVKALRNVVSNMQPKEEIALPQTPKTPNAKAAYDAEVQKGVLAALKTLNINPELLKVDTYQVSQGAGNIGDNDFLDKWSSGELPATSANMKRAEKLIR